MAIAENSLAYFFNEQCANWQLANDNFAGLKQVKVKQFSEESVPVIVQFNPARLVSTAAKTDTKTIQNRACFLCSNNRPSEQEKLDYNNNFEILVNPFPIFPEHFTIPHKHHIKQQILPFIDDMLSLANDFPSYLVFYNGPRCGASAPDHMHFQMGNKGFLPLEYQYDSFEKLLIESFSFQNYYFIDSGFYTAIAIESDSMQDAARRFKFLYKILKKGDEEPLMNVVCWKQKDRFILIVIPRKIHRPSCFYAEGDKHLMISPASVDLGGVIITPIESHFEKITYQDLLDISKQVNYSYQEIQSFFSSPTVTVGIVRATTINIDLIGKYLIKGSTDTNVEVSGNQVFEFYKGFIQYKGESYSSLELVPQKIEDNYFIVHDVTIGVGFHWQRNEKQQFNGTIRLIIDNDKIVLINQVLVEDYIQSVVASEMSATSSLEFLKAHAVISRSWLFALLQEDKTFDINNDEVADNNTIIKWYNHFNHSLFDVCADDHCQRYQGTLRISTENISKAITETKGEILLFESEICDARFSKCCGGITENFDTCWENKELPYLSSHLDAKLMNNSFALDSEQKVCNWIKSSPTVFCNTNEKRVLTQVLPMYDQETTDFFRWKKVYSQHELSTLVHKRSGIDFGVIHDIRPIKRGKSGRLEIIEIVGTTRTMRIGKELEIRKWLSDTHLYSSAFIVERDDERNFIFYGAGWGHGVGLCQIGAAVMSEQGYSYKEILQHYYTGVDIVSVY